MRTAEVLRDVIEAERPQYAGLIRPYFTTALEGPTESELEREAEKGRAIAFLRVSLDLFSGLARSTNNCVIQGECLLTVMGLGKDSDKVVLDMTKDIVAIGYTVEPVNKRFGRSALMPITLGTKSFHAWRPLGDEFDEDVEIDEDLATKDQIIEFQYVDE